MAVSINEDECVGCGTCVEECPSDALSMEDDICIVDEEECVECEACIEACPSGAISL